MIAVTDSETQFYPTPKELVKEIIKDVDFYKVNTILEPSAGKGDILNALLEYVIAAGYEHRYGYIKHYDDIDCVEIDKNLQAILRSRGYRVVWNDFLTYKPFKQYDLIIMNPPFKNGDKHLLKALELQKYGGGVICILNAETIKNPYSQTRRELVKLLEEHNAEITYKTQAFSKAERKTDVEIAVIKVFIEKVIEESELYGKHYEQAKRYAEFSADKSTEIVVDDYIKKAVTFYNAEVSASLEFIKTYKALRPYIGSDFGDKDEYAFTTIRLVTSAVSLDNGRDSTGGNEVEVNEYLQCVRLKYWRELFNNPKFIGKLTYDMQKQYQSTIDKLKDVEFNEFNINQITVDMNSHIYDGIKKAVISMADNLTAKYSWYPECQNNVHYYNGWKTNIAHKINYKVILPCSAYEQNYYKKWKLDVHSATGLLEDLEKVLNYFDGNMTEPVDLHEVIRLAEENPKNIKCKFFNVTFYKKGTCHIVFTNHELIDRFNIYVGQGKNWLPPYYGKVKYDDLSDDDKKVVDSFSSKEEYAKVYKNQSYYLGAIGNTLMIESKN